MACVSGTGAGSGRALCEGWKDPYRSSSGFGKDYAWNRTDTQAAGNGARACADHYDPGAVDRADQRGIFV